MSVLTIEDARRVLSGGKSKKIAVIGDVMLDRFFWGVVSRISPEAPVPIIDLEEESYHLGGAANVGNNLKSLGLEPVLCGVIGGDPSGEKFLEIAEERGLNAGGLFSDKKRPTTVKTRVIGNNQHIARLDREARASVSIDGERFIINTVVNMDDLGGIVFEDYNKGAISSHMIIEITRYALKREIPVFVDPKRDNFYEYKNAAFFKPNKKEAAQALGVEIKTKEDVLEAGKSLLYKLNCDNVLITLGKEGMLLIESSGESFSVPTIARQVADVSGAGDTAIAALVAASVGGANPRQAALIANIASGYVCEKPGVVSITHDELVRSIDKALKYNNLANL